MNDLISRQSAIDVADAVWSVTGDKNVAKVWDQIKDLPSVQPVVISKSENATECEDAVSRFEVLRLIDYSSNDLNDSVDNWYFQGKVKELPSVTPKQPGWIPCSDALPEYDGEYLVTKRSFGWNCEEYKETDIARYEKQNGWHKADQVLAWQLLPTPYREGGQDGD